MKSKPLVIALAFALAAASPSLMAQDGGIKVTTVIHPDKSRTDTQTDLSAKTSEEKTYDAAGKLIRHIVYALDDEGHPTGGTVFSPKSPKSPKGQAAYRFTYTRDAQGRISEESDTAPNGKLIRRLVYRFGSNGQVSGIDVYDSNGKLIGSSGKKTRPSRRR